MGAGEVRRGGPDGIGDVGGWGDPRAFAQEAGELLARHEYGREEEDVEDGELGEGVGDLLVRGVGGHGDCIFFTLVRIVDELEG